MQEYDEKKEYTRREYTRMEVDCEIIHRIADAAVSHHGRCISISGAGVAFLTEQAIEIGKALEIKILPGNKAIVPPLLAFIETVRSERQAGRFHIAAVIKGIKAN